MKNTLNPLYVGEESNVVLSCQANSLKLTSPNLPLRRYPIARISRIVAGTKTAWDEGTIQTLMQSQIPIIFSHKTEQPLGACLPTQNRTLKIPQAVVEKWQQQAVINCFNKWAYSQQYQSAIAALKGYGDRKNLKINTGIKLFYPFFKPMLKQHNATLIQNITNNFFIAYAIERLNDVGIDQRLIYAKGPKLSCILALCLRWDLYRFIDQTIKNKQIEIQHATLSKQQIAVLIEMRKPRLDKLTAKFIVAFYQWAQTQ